MNNIWIVNDYLTCVQGTRTFWHMLLEIDGTVDKTGVPFARLPDAIEKDNSPCDIIIRNGTFFRHINKDVKQIALVQDIYDDDEIQLDVCRNVDCVVFNSEHTKEKRKEFIDQFKMVKVIPLGVNQEIFKPYGKRFSTGNPVGIFVGDYNSTKGTHIFSEIVNENSFITFHYVSKSGNRIDRKNVINHSGGVNEIGMAKLYNEADFLIMCSPRETLHLASIEACLCGKPVIGTNTGWFSDYFDDVCGARVDNPTLENFNSAINKVLENRNSYNPRKYILENTPFTWEGCKKSWENLIKELSSG